MNLFHAIFKAAFINRTAIVYEHRQITYDELRDQTLTFARGLSWMGVGPGDRVALLLNDSPEFVAAFVAICSYGAIAAPINMALRLEEQRAILNDCTASVAIVEEEICDPLLEDSQLRNLKQVVVVRRETGQAQFAAATQYKRGQVETRLLADLFEQSRTEVTPEFAAPNENQPAFILYTSGSTGEPKGAVHRQSDIFHTNETYGREVLRLRGGDRLFSSSRLPFAYGLGNAFTFPLLNGCTSILCREKPAPELISRVFKEYEPTIFFGVPVVYRMLLDEARKHPLDCSSLRLCVSAGEALPARLGEECESAFGVPVLDGIGSTEMLHMWMSNHEDDIVYGSSGTLLKGYDARLLDPEGNPTAAGEEGNLWVRGASAAIEYWNRPKTTANTFVEGWVRTGDLYREDAAGHWFHMGRSDDCFKSSGQWVSPVEVEGVLLHHEGVNRAAVVEYFDDDHLPCACAFIVRSETSADNNELEHELKELARSSLARFKQPRLYMFVKELPYTVTGKIQRFKLRERLRESPMSNVQRPMSRDPGIDS
jgi:benzoate-CoA ligase family protein